MKKIASLLLSTFGFAVLLLANPTPAFAAPTDCNATPNAPVCQATKGSKATTDPSARSTSLGDQLKVIVNILLFVLGAIAVIMIVVGGLRYTLSAGDASAITGAKNTILYAVIGLVVAVLAYAIVNFVLGAF